MIYIPYFVVPCRNFDGKFLIDKEGFVHIPGENIADEVQELLSADAEF